MNIETPLNRIDRNEIEKLRKRIRDVFEKQFREMRGPYNERFNKRSEKLAKNVEISIYNEMLDQSRSRFDGKVYRNLFRKVFFCLIFTDRYSLEIRKNVDNKTIDVVQIASMTREQLDFGKSRIQVNQRQDQDIFHDKYGPEFEKQKKQHEGVFVCGRCKSKNTSYTQAQTRSADEGITTMVTCGDCNYRFKFS
jgi:transcription elongation factor S-II